MKFKTEISAGGIVYKKEGDQLVWLITQHSKNKNWAFPKGIIGDNIRNEKPAEAAIREVREEGGVEAKIVNETPLDIHYMYQFQGYLIKKTVYMFIMEYVSGDPNDHDEEVTEAMFLPTDELQKKLSYKSDREMFPKVLEIVKETT